MNKQEAIEKIEKEKSNLNTWEDLTRNRALDDALAIVRKLDEPEKAVVPQFIDTWIQGAKYNGFDLYEAMTDDEMSDKVATWIVCNSEIFAKTWLFGYEVEKEKLYTVKFANEEVIDKEEIRYGMERIMEIALNYATPDNSDVDDWHSVYSIADSIYQDLEKEEVARIPLEKLY